MNGDITMHGGAPQPAKLTIGPLLFHWTRDRRADFYARIADEADVDCVYIGEVVCSKRLPWYEDDLPQIAERLKRAGKQVVFSTPALISTDREAAIVRGYCDAGELVEINDLSSLRVLAGEKFVSGALINVFNEGTLDVMRRMGAIRVNMPVELSATAIATLAAHNIGGETELFAFGRQPIAISQRCYHARAHDLHKDACQFVCGQDADGLKVDQLDGEPLFSVNGTQTLSHGYLVMFDMLALLQAAGVTHFRLSPQAVDMVEVARLHRAVLNGAMHPAEALETLQAGMAPTEFVNGYVHGKAGMAWVEPA
jgi:collagenase-like PrtC family protease